MNKRVAWNKGLTKETDKRVKKYVEHGSGLKKGHIPWNKGLVGIGNDIIHMAEWNKKVSAGVKKYYSDKLKPTRQGPLGRAWTNYILKRDLKTCRKCGKPASIAHHIYPIKEFPGLIFMLWNGISVCLPCHNRIHTHHSYSPTLYVYSIARSICLSHNLLG
jgi:5-methylcytosine-specific restriction endonuclease McrA